MAKVARVVQLVRVSGEKQVKADSPETQRKALSELLKQRQGTVVAVIDPDAEARAQGRKGANLSGGSDVRPDIDRLITMAKAKGLDELHVMHLDRITRHDDPMERMRVYSALAECGAVIVEANGTVTDPCNPTDEIAYYVKTWASASERRKISERATAAAKRLTAAGRGYGAQPMGIAFDSKTGIWSLTEEIDKVRQAFAEFAAGKSIAKVTQILGLRDQSSGGKLLRRTIYRGLNSAGVKVFDPPPVDEGVWLAAQARLAQIRTHQIRQRETQKSDLWLTSIASSDLEPQAPYDMSTPVRHKLCGTRRKGRKDTYKCTCNGDPTLTTCGFGFPQAEKVHAWVDDALLKLTSDPGKIAVVREASPDTTAEREALEKTIKRLDQRHERMKDAYYEGLETREGFDKRAAMYKAERDTAQARLDALTATKPVDPSVVEAWLQGFTWDKAWSAQVKRDWLRKYTRRVTITRSGVGQVVLRLPGRDGVVICGTEDRAA